MEAGSLAISASTWVWNEFGEEIKGGFKGFLERKFKDLSGKKKENESLQYMYDRWMGFNWNMAEQRYRDRMRQLYGYILIVGASTPVSINDIFIDVYILEKPEAFRRFDITKLQELQTEPDQLDKNIKREAGFSVVSQKFGHRLFILGKPGAGKTTFLKYLVYQTLSGRYNKIPIFVTIKDWADSGKDLLGYIVNRFDICDLPAARPFIEYVLETGRALLLFDGLDEVKLEGGQRDQIITSLRDFCNKYLEAQAIITCRIAATDYYFTGFTYIEMADFNDNQINIYAHKWFGNDFQKANQFMVELSQDQNRGVRDLGRSPLLLSMICLAFDETLHIPQRRLEIYEESVDALLKKWDSARKIQRDEIYKKLSLGRKRQMLARLAAQCFEKGEIFFQKKQLTHQIEEYIKNLPPDDADEIPDGEAVLQSIVAQHGILVERATSVYAFAHLTFQEYFTSKYIVDNAQQGTLERMMVHLTDQRWREVFISTASLLNQADEYLTLMQTTIANSIQNDKILGDIQSWITRKTKAFASFHPGSVRCFFWIFILNHANSRDLAIALNHAIGIPYTNAYAIALAFFLERELAHNNPYNLVSDPKNDRILKRTLDSALIQFNEKAHDLALSIARTRGTAFDDYLSRDLDSALDHVLVLVYDRIFEDISRLSSQSAKTFFMDLSLLFLLQFIDIYKYARDINKIQIHTSKLLDIFERLIVISKTTFPVLSQSLELLVRPTHESTSGEWTQFGQNILNLIIESRDIGYQWELNTKQVERVRQYLQANQFLLDCLEVAYVSNREGILNNVLTAKKYV